MVFSFHVRRVSFFCKNSPPLSSWAVIYNCRFTHLTFTWLFHADWLWQLTSGSERTPEAKPANLSSNTGHMCVHTPLPLLCSAETSNHPSSSHTHSVLTSDGCLRNFAGATRCGDECAWMFVSVSANVNETSSMCLFACLLACVRVWACWLSMKDKAVWISGLSYYGFNTAFLSFKVLTVSRLRF